MATVTMTRDEIDAVVAKLDGLDVTDDERLLLHAVLQLAGDAFDTSLPPQPAPAGRVADNGIDVGSF
jgi:hypothetical protein